MGVDLGSQWSLQCLRSACNCMKRGAMCGGGAKRTALTDFVIGRSLWLHTTHFTAWAAVRSAGTATHVPPSPPIHAQYGSCTATQSLGGGAGGRRKRRGGREVWGGVEEEDGGS